MDERVTFDKVVAFLKKTEPRNAKVLKYVDAVSGFVIAASAGYFHELGDGARWLVSMIGVKNELMKVGTLLFDTIMKKAPPTPADRLERMEVAYAMAAHAAFLDALDDEAAELERIGPRDTHKRDEPLELSLRLPHPADPNAVTRAHIESFYRALTSGFLKGFSGSDDRELYGRLVRGSMRHFDQLYFSLAATFGEFSLWANLHEVRQLRDRVESISTFVDAHWATTEPGAKQDAGLEHLAQLVGLIPAGIERTRQNHVLRALENRYARAADAPIAAGDGEGGGDDHPTYPTKRQAFIPQSFRAVRYDGRVEVERDSWWADIPQRHDLAAFLLGYFTSPHALQHPLIILGQPGSGKSLLTEIIAAHFVQSFCTPVRVVLRAVDADAEIGRQIEQQIQSDTEEQIAFADFARDLSPFDPLFLFDGYDELLQASGRVFANYPRRVADFLRRERDIGRKARAVITSRMTLIGKADLPIGCTVVRLDEFDAPRVKQWIAIWNRVNREFFKRRDIRPFAIPSGVPNVEAISRQPLLLFLLALFDSEANGLRNSGDLDPTQLYDRLIRQFIEREQTKHRDFREAAPAIRQERIDREMERLGTAAAGMFSRRRLDIRSSELSSDLEFFGLEREAKPDAAEGRSLTEADVLVGSFFFIHRSRAKTRTTRGVEQVDETFEFLHNTFGEFLTADFVLTRLFQLTDVVSLRREYPKMNIAASGEGRRSWLATTSYTPLHTRPVILSMLREWCQHRLERKAISTGNFIHSLDELIVAELKKVLGRHDWTELLNAQTADPPPFLIQLATYSLNLVLLRTFLSDTGYTFDDSSFDEKNAWHRLVHLWESAFAWEGLAELPMLLSVSRAFSARALKPNAMPVPVATDRVGLIRDVASAIGDDITFLLASMVRDAPEEPTETRLLDIVTREQLDLLPELRLRRLRHGKSSTPAERQFLQQSFSVDGRTHRHIPVDLLSLAWDEENRHDRAAIMLFILRGPTLPPRTLIEIGNLAATLPNKDCAKLSETILNRFDLPTLRSVAMNTATTLLARGFETLDIPPEQLAAQPEVAAQFFEFASASLDRGTRRKRLDDVLKLILMSSYEELLTFPVLVRLLECAEATGVSCIWADGMLAKFISMRSSIPYPMTLLARGLRVTRLLGLSTVNERIVRELRADRVETCDDFAIELMLAQKRLGESAKIRAAFADNALPFDPGKILLRDGAEFRKIAAQHSDRLAQALMLYLKLR